MFDRTERAIVHMTQPPFVQPRSRWNVAEVDALRRGVSMRTLYTPEGHRRRGSLGAARRGRRPGTRG